MPIDFASPKNNPRGTDSTSPTAHLSSDAPETARCASDLETLEAAQRTLKLPPIDGKPTEAGYSSFVSFDEPVEMAPVSRKPEPSAVTKHGNDPVIDKKSMEDPPWLKQLTLLNTINMFCLVSGGGAFYVAVQQHLRDGNWGGFGLTALKFGALLFLCDITNNRWVRGRKYFDRIKAERQKKDGGEGETD